MLTRAYITELDLEHSKVRVRMPWIDGIENSSGYQLYDSDLCWATIMYTPGIEINYNINDVVIVGFEDNNVGRPIVLGYLKLDGVDLDKELHINATDLTVSSKANLPLNTNIGKTPYEEIFNSVNEVE